LPAGEEGVATGTDFYADVAFVGGTRFKRVSTGANNIYFIVSGMNSGFHFKQSLS
jgi:hypothetical protein